MWIDDDLDDFDDAEDENDENDWDDVAGWLAAHPGFGRPELNDELWQEMHDDAVMGGYAEDE